MRCSLKYGIYSLCSLSLELVRGSCHAFLLHDSEVIRDVVTEGEASKRIFSWARVALKCCEVNRMFTRLMEWCQKSIITSLSTIMGGFIEPVVR